MARRRRLHATLTPHVIEKPASPVDLRRAKVFAVPWAFEPTEASVTMTLATLAVDPMRIQHVAPGDLPSLIGETEALRAALWARLQTACVPPPRATNQQSEPDQLLTVDEAAERLSVTRRWMYRKAAKLPFTRRIGRNTLRFSARGLERWKESQK